MLSIGLTRPPRTIWELLTSRTPPWLPGGLITWLIISCLPVRVYGAKSPEYLAPQDVWESRSITFLGSPSHSLEDGDVRAQIGGNVSHAHTLFQSLLKRGAKGPGKSTSIQRTHIFIGEGFIGRIFGRLSSRGQLLSFKHSKKPCFCLSHTHTHTSLRWNTRLTEPCAHTHTGLFWQRDPFGLQLHHQHEVNIAKTKVACKDTNVLS